MTPRDRFELSRMVGATTNARFVLATKIQACFPTCSSPGDPPHTCKDTKSTDLAGDRFARLGDIQGVASPKNQGHSRVTTGPPAPVARSAHREGGILHGTRRDVPRCLYRRAGASESRSGC